MHTFFHLTKFEVILKGTIGKRALVFLIICALFLRGATDKQTDGHAAAQKLRREEKEEATFGEKLCKKRRPLATW